MYCGGDPVNRIDPSGHMKRSSSGSPQPSSSKRPKFSPLSPSEFLSDADLMSLLNTGPFASPTGSASFSSGAAATGNAGSSGHPLATISTGSSNSAGTTGSGTATYNYRRIDESIRLHLANPTVEGRFQKSIQTAKPIPGLDGPQTWLTLTTAFNALRDGTELTVEARGRIGVDYDQMKNASGRVYSWVRTEMKRADSNNVRLN